MKKIVYFEDVFGNYGGIEKMITNITSVINKDKFKIYLVVNKILSNEYIDELKKSNVEIVELQNEYISNPIKRHLVGIKKFKELIKNEQYNSIHFHISNAIDLLYVYVAKKNGVKNRIAHSHNSNATSMLKKFAHYFFKIFLSGTPTHYLACSDKAAKWLYSAKVYANNDYVLIKNAIRTENYIYNDSLRNKIKEKNNWNEKFVVGHIGRFNIQKNHRCLIDIFDEILKKKSNSILLLIGEGELQDSVKQYVITKKLEDKVLFYGVTPKVNELLQAMDVFVLPSLYEGLPVVLVESQAASLPAVVSDTITQEINISNYISYYSLEKKPEEWAEIVIKNAQIKREDNSNNLVTSGFDLMNVVQKLERLYDSLR